MKTVPQKSPRSATERLQYLLPETSAEKRGNLPNYSNDI